MFKQIFGMGTWLEKKKKKIKATFLNLNVEIILSSNERSKNIKTAEEMCYQFKKKKSYQKTKYNSKLFFKIRGFLSTKFFYIYILYIYIYIRWF